MILDADKAENILRNISSILPLDRNGILCDNILNFPANQYNILLQTYLYADPEVYEPTWIDNVVGWWNDLDLGWQALIAAGTVVVVTGLTALTAGGFAYAAGATATTISAVVGGAIAGGLIAGGVNITMQIALGADSINLGDVALSTFVGSASGAMGKWIEIFSTPAASGLNVPWGKAFWQVTKQSLVKTALISIGLGLFSASLQSSISGEPMSPIPILGGVIANSFMTNAEIDEFIVGLFSELVPYGLEKLIEIIGL